MNFLEAMIANSDNENFTSAVKNFFSHKGFVIEEVDGINDYPFVKQLAKKKLKDGAELFVFLIKPGSESDVIKKVLDKLAGHGIFISYTGDGRFKFSFAYIDNKVKKSYTYFVDKNKQNKTFIKAISNLNFTDFNEVLSAFSISLLINEFYLEIKKWYAWALKHAYFSGGDKDENVIKLIIKLVFAWFLKEKGFVSPEIFDEEHYLKKGETSDNYYTTIIKPLYKNNGFDFVFNETENEEVKVPDFLFFSDEVEEVLPEIFGKKKVKVKGLVNILKDYNFTVSEALSFDVEISLNPELLGYIFENLLSLCSQDTKTKRKSTGSYYTPTEVVEFMVSAVLLEHLKTRTNIEEDKLLDILTYIDDVSLTEQERREIFEAIKDLKILDPAVGSGAFIVGVIHKLVYLLNLVDPDNEMWRKTQLEKQPDKELVKAVFEESNPNYARKFFIIKDFVYGCDIQQMAIQICKLRLVLNLISDGSKKALNTITLLNLSNNFIVADFLLGREVDKFDIVIGNPPYVQIQKIRDEKLKKEYKKNNPETFDGLGDIYCLFYERGINLLKRGGHLCFITSNKWMRAGYGEGLRKFLIRFTPKLLVDLGPGVFESAEVDTNILLIEKREAIETYKLKAIEYKFKQKGGLI